MVVGLADLADLWGPQSTRNIQGGINDAVAVAIHDSRASGHEATGSCGGIIARNRSVAVLVTVHRGRVLAIVIVGGLDLLVVDQFLSLQHAAQQESDDDQHNGDFDEGEPALVLFLNGHSVLLRICRRLKAVSRPSINGIKLGSLTSDRSQIWGVASRIRHQGNGLTSGGDDSADKRDSRNLSSAGERIWPAATSPPNMTRASAVSPRSARSNRSIWRTQVGTVGSLT